MDLKNKLTKESTAPWNVKEKQFPENGKLERQIKFLVRYAILAPSGHNSQPWKFRVGKNYLEISPDWERKRKEVDPGNRELFISLGAAIKNMEIAAQHFGLIFSKEYIIDEASQKTKINLTFQSGKQTVEENQHLFEAITQRITKRTMFEEKKIDPGVLKKLAKEDKLAKIETKLFQSSEEKKKMAELIYQSNRVWFKSKELINELHKWLSDDISGFKVETASNLKKFTDNNIDRAEEKAIKEKKNALKCGAILAIASKNDEIETWIKCGELFEEIALEATARGLSLAFFNTVVELKTQRGKLTEMCGGKCYPQLMFRVGYSKDRPKHTPRRGFNEVLVK